MNKTLFSISKNMVNKLLSILISIKNFMIFKNNILLTNRKEIEFLHMSFPTFSCHMIMEHTKIFNFIG